MAHIGYGKCEFATQGKSIGTARQKDRQKEWWEVLAITLRASTPYDAVHGQSVGQRVYDPFKWEMVHCPNFALLMNALAKNETVKTMEFHQVMTNQDKGAPFNWIVIKLTNARIISVELATGRSGFATAKSTAAVDQEETVLVSASFDKIEVSSKNHKDGDEKQFMDSWATA